ncbi:transmembrane protein 134 isoform X7 [Pipistrellus kuhlii]|uniref:transmembrane protein 134 isoform X7 n=1 Tax=Pipistrellus kuhlii TaxID=59472 RepID=UPI001E26E94F|nr:transmembrane protein 134 isoform X7 [Pipistrellus kuhlii]
MSAARAQFSIDDAFELSLEDAGPGPEPSGVARFGPLHFERRARFEAADEDKQSRLRYQVPSPTLDPFRGDLDQILVPQTWRPRPALPWHPTSSASEIPSIVPRPPNPGGPRALCRSPPSPCSGPPASAPTLPGFGLMIHKPVLLRGEQGGAGRPAAVRLALLPARPPARPGDWQGPAVT